MNGKQFLEMLARLPARVWLQAILGLIGFVVLAVLGFAVIAGVAAVVLVAILIFKARQHFKELLAVHDTQRFSKSHTSGNPISSCMPRYCGTSMPALVPLSLRKVQAWRMASAATLKPSPG